MKSGVAERRPVNKPGKTYPRPIRDLLKGCLGPTFARQGFAAAGVVTHWPEIVGTEIAALAEPIKLNWPRNQADTAEPATLVLRAEGPAAIEIQHMSGQIIERVNRFFGWRAVGRIAIRQAPLAQAAARAAPPAPDAREAERIAKSLDVADPSLRDALGRLGAAVKRF
jgi:hypothetical protein